MKLFRDNGLPIILFDYRENWINFVTFLLWFLAGQPIGFLENPTGKAKKIRVEMLALQRPHNILVEALAIVNHEGVYHWLLAVSGDKKIRMIGQVESLKQKMPFRSTTNWEVSKYRCIPAVNTARLRIYDVHPTSLRRAPGS
jgi:hypothetical protein